MRDKISEQHRKVTKITKGVHVSKTLLIKITEHRYLRNKVFIFLKITGDKIILEELVSIKKRTFTR